MDPFGILPHDLIYVCLKCLGLPWIWNCAMVSKRWNALIKNSALWKAVYEYSFHSKRLLNNSSSSSSPYQEKSLELYKNGYCEAIVEIGDCISDILTLRNGDLAIMHESEMVSIFSFDIMRVINQFNTSGWYNSFLGPELPNGNLVIYDEYDLKVYDIETGICVETTSTECIPYDHMESIVTTILLQDGSLAILCGNNGRNGGTGSWIDIWKPKVDMKYPSAKFRMNDIRTECMIELWDGCLAVGASDSNVYILSRESKEKTKLSTGHRDLIHDIMEFDENHIISASKDGRVKLLSRLTGECIDTWHEHCNAVKCILKLNDYIVSYATDGVVKIIKMCGEEDEENEENNRVVFALSDVCVSDYDRPLLKLHDDLVVLKSNRIMAWSCSKNGSTGPTGQIENSQGTCIVKSGQHDNVSFIRKTIDGLVITWAENNSIFKVWNLPRDNLLRSDSI